MHGGIGMTDEHEIGFFMKRSRVAELTFGNTRFHQRPLRHPDGLRDARHRTTRSPTAARSPSASPAPRPTSASPPSPSIRKTTPRSLHVRAADEARALRHGTAADLDMNAVIDVALASGADAIHPGYGFLAERADFAACLRRSRPHFRRPRPTHLDLFGDKAAARAAAIAGRRPRHPRP
jgi:hypothetical protein